MPRFLRPLILLLLLVAPAPAQDKPNRNITLGMPVATDRKVPGVHDEVLLLRPQYVLSYSDKNKTPNWVAWRLAASDLGKADRGPFEPDPDLPDGFVRVSASHYRASGFDLGHMCPSADRESTQKNNDATFFTSNIVPQSPNLNRVTWEHLEVYCRGLVKDGSKELLIVAGPSGQGGEGDAGLAVRIGPPKARILVPSHTWKAILVLDAGQLPTKRTRAIAVVIPNTQTVRPDWSRYRVSIDDVEELTGLTLFPGLSPTVSEVLKAHVDAEDVTHAK